MAITEVIPTFTTPEPNREQNPADFADSADLMVSEFNDVIASQNTLADQINAESAIMNGYSAAAAASETAAASSATAAEGFADDAAASAASAVNSPGTNATSTTSMAIGYGSKAFTLAQTGKAFVVGQWVSVTSASNVANWMNGAITAFNSGTGAITVNVTMFGGSGTYTDWVIVQSAPMVDSLYEIGDMVTDNERGTLFVRGGKTFVRSGTVLASAGYPLAAVDTGTMVNGLPSTGGGTIAITGQPATNGTGTWVAPIGSASSVLVSTDDMRTWSAVLHNNPNPVVSVTWVQAATRFIGFGNSTTAVTSSYSSSGTSWTNGTTVSPSPAPNAAGTVKVISDGTVALAVWSPASATVNCILTTANGSAFTLRQLSSTLNSGVSVALAVAPSLGVARWVVRESSASAGWVSTASDASAWQASGTFTSNALRGICGAGAFYLAAETGGVIRKSTDGVTWSSSSLPSVGSTSVATTDLFAVGGLMSGGYPSWLMYDGTRVVTGTSLASNGANAAQGLFGYTTDGLIWETRQLSTPCDASATAQLCVFSGNGYLGTLPCGATSATGRQYSQSWINACDYVGKARPVIDPNTGSITPKYVMVAK